MALKITHVKEAEVPTPTAAGRVNQDLAALKSEMTRLSGGMVLEIEPENEKGIRGTKMLVTKAAAQLGAKWQHWSVGTKVFAKPMEAAKLRGRRQKAERANLGDFRG
jgi:spore cortex formation protein SpoVR/YcgB (stage V sporulation)